MPGRQHELDDEYFQRIDAITYVMQHDDGQQTGNLEEADVVLVGVSRTSKTPTSIYLANRGIKAANVPIVPDQPLSEILFNLNHPLVVGLTEDPRRLVDLRRSRMRQSLGGTETAYTDIDAVRKEVADARRLFGRYGWPVIDVTRRSIEGNGGGHHAAWCATGTAASRKAPMPTCSAPICSTRPDPTAACLGGGGG